MRRLSESEREDLFDAGKEALADCKETLAISDAITLRWSNQLTSTAGNVTYDYQRRRYLVKLSYPILKGVYLSHGRNVADYSVRETVAHELCHIVGGTRMRGHDREWERRIQLCGYLVKVRHQFKAGASLFGAGDFSVGDKVSFELKGEEVSGVLLKKNPKKAVVELDSGDRWRVPYSRLSEIIASG